MPYKDKKKQAESARRHYEKNKKKVKDRAKEWTAKNREDIRAVTNKWKSQGCCIPTCNETELCCMQAHHMEPFQKDFNIGDAVRQGRSVAYVREELEKCICVCANCHAKMHAGVLNI